MAVERRYCINHPDRTAIGVCVETKKPICGECSTRYNGVNYSREGLEILRERRRKAAKGGVGALSLALVALVMSAVMWGLYMVFGSILMKMI